MTTHTESTVHTDATVHTEATVLERPIPAGLEPWVATDLLGTTSVEVVRMLDTLTGGLAPEARLALALAVRAPELGHVHLPLADPEAIFRGADLEQAEDDTELPGGLPEPPPELAAWLAVLRACPAVEAGTVEMGTADTAAVGVPEPPGRRPFVLDGDRLYLRRHLDHERRVAARISALAERPESPLGDPDLLAELLPPGDEADPNPQWLAASTALRRAITVIAGGPGTGKTYTVARLLAAMRGRDGRAPAVALAAPTGKAAARMTEAVRTAAADLDADTAEWLGGLEATTIHRLLGVDPSNPTRFRHHRDRPLPLDVLIVDETSMVSLSLADRLLDAVGGDTRIVFVGDPDQLASVDAGAFLADLVAAARRPGPTAGPWAEAVVVLDEARRFGRESGIARLADAIRSGDPMLVEEVLRAGADDLTWIRPKAGATQPFDAQIGAVLVEHGKRVRDAAAEGDAGTALAGLRSVGLLCARRTGPFGVARWNGVLDRLVLGDAGRTTRLPVGRPVIITANDQVNRLANGDVAVIVKGPDGPMAALADGDGVRLLPPARLTAVEPVHALTIHKSQGSEYDHAVVLLPEAESRVLTRELLYTAVTRAKRHLTIVGAPASIAGAVGRPTRRASGLADRLTTPEDRWTRC